MALIQCPECGQSISDKAVRCPKCGYPIVEVAPKPVGGDSSGVSSSPDLVFYEPYQEESAAESANGIERNKRRFPLIPIIIGIVCVCIIVVAIVFLKSGIPPKVTSIEITKWKLTDAGTYSDTYEGTVIADTSAPFIAVIGHYDDSNAYRFVNMQDGSGILQVSISDDDDPTSEYRPIGYLTGKAVDSSFIKSLKCKDGDYYDYSYSDETDCVVEITFELKNNADGIIFFEVRNDLTRDVEYNCVAAVVDGVGTYSLYCEGLPYKSRGIEVEVTPILFCKYNAVQDGDYVIEDEFALDKYEGTYLNSYSGSETVSFEDHFDGVVIYTKELKAGGEKANRGAVQNCIAYVDDGVFEISTYDSDFDGGTILEPEYEFHVLGYISWNLLEE